MVELDGRPILAAGHRAGEFGYVDADPVQGTFTTESDQARRVRRRRHRALLDRRSARRAEPHRLPLAGEFGYVDDPPVRGLFSPTDPFPTRIDLDRLR
jgi:hypothetical protein